MARLNVLIGIGMMLVGALSYALPLDQEFSLLFPAFAGIVIATGGFVIMRHPGTIKLLTGMNAMAAVLILVWACLKVVTDLFRHDSDALPLVSDIYVISLAGLLLYCALKEWVNEWLLIRQEEEAMRALADK